MEKLSNLMDQYSNLQANEIDFALSDGNEDHNVGGNLESRTM
jgi:hypothetical protein